MCLSGLLLKLHPLLQKSRTKPVRGMHMYVFYLVLVSIYNRFVKIFSFTMDLTLGDILTMLYFMLVKQC